jgi:hypothetical protein
MGERDEAARGPVRSGSGILRAGPGDRPARGGYGSRRAAIPPPRLPARGQGPPARPAVPAGRPGRAHRARPLPRPGRPRPVRLGGARAAGRPAYRRPARGAVRPARAPRAGPAAPRLLDLRGPARPVPRYRPGVRGADRGGRGGHRSGGGHRPGRLVGAASGPAAGRPGARHVPGGGDHPVPRLAGRTGRRPDRIRPGAVRVRARPGQRRRLPRRAPGAAARRGHQPRRTDQPPVPAGLARPVRPGRTARPAPGAPPARLPVPAGVPAGRRGQRAVRPLLPSRGTPPPGPDRGGAGRCLRHLPLARLHLRDRRRHRRARARHRPPAILRDPGDPRRAR